MKRYRITAVVEEAVEGSSPVVGDEAWIYGKAGSDVESVTPLLSAEEALAEIVSAIDTVNGDLACDRVRTILERYEASR